MKKFIIPFLALVALAQPAKAMTNEQVYKMCKPYVESGFDLNAKNQETCFGFFVGVAHTSHVICTHTKMRIKKLRETQPIDAFNDGQIEALSQFAAWHGSEASDLDSYPVSAHILNFINWIEKNPHELSEIPVSRTWFQNYFCDADQ